MEKHSNASIIRQNKSTKNYRLQNKFVLQPIKHTQKKPDKKHELLVNTYLDSNLISNIIGGGKLKQLMTKTSVSQSPKRKTLG